MEQNFTQMEQKICTSGTNIARKDVMEQYHKTNYLSYGTKFYTSKTKFAQAEQKLHERNTMQQYYGTNYPSCGTHFFTSRTKIYASGTNVTRKEYNEAITWNIS